MTATAPGAGPICGPCQNTEQACARNYPCCEHCTHFTEPEQPLDLTPDRPPRRPEQPMTTPTPLTRDTPADLLARARPLTDTKIRRAVERVDQAHDQLRTALTDHAVRDAARRDVERLERQLAEARKKTAPDRPPDLMNLIRHFQSRPGGAWETTRTRGLYRRLTLRRADGRVYLNRWGIGHDRVGGVLLHRMDAPDPGIDLHDHPWPFVSIILWGGYTEERADIREAAALATTAAELDEISGWRTRGNRGHVVQRMPLSVKAMRLHECHTITDLHKRTSWSLVIKGPRRRSWGFYLPSGYMPERQYDDTVRADRRDLWSDQAVANRPWNDTKEATTG